MLCGTHMTSHNIYLIIWVSNLDPSLFLPWKISLCYSANIIERHNMALPETETCPLKKFGKTKSRSDMFMLPSRPLCQEVSFPHLVHKNAVLFLENLIFLQLLGVNLYPSSTRQGPNPIQVSSAVTQAMKCISAWLHHLIHMWSISWRCWQLGKNSKLSAMYKLTFSLILLVFHWFNPESYHGMESFFLSSWFYLL